MFYGIFSKDLSNYEIGKFSLIIYKIWNVRLISKLPINDFIWAKTLYKSYAIDWVISFVRFTFSLSHRNLNIKLVCDPESRNALHTYQIPFMSLIKP